MDRKEWVTVDMCGFDGARKSNYSVKCASRNEVNGNGSDKDDVKGKRIKNVGALPTEWIGNCNSF